MSCVAGCMMADFSLSSWLSWSWFRPNSPHCNRPRQLPKGHNVTYPKPVQPIKLTGKLINVLMGMRSTCISFGTSTYVLGQGKVNPTYLSCLHWGHNSSLTANASPPCFRRPVQSLFFHQVHQVYWKSISTPGHRTGDDMLSLHRSISTRRPTRCPI